MGVEPDIRFQAADPHNSPLLPLPAPCWTVWQMPPDTDGSIYKCPLLEDLIMS